MLVIYKISTVFRKDGLNIKLQTPVEFQKMHHEVNGVLTGRQTVQCDAHSTV